MVRRVDHVVFDAALSVFLGVDRPRIGIGVTELLVKPGAEEVGAILIGHVPECAPIITSPPALDLGLVFRLMERSTEPMRREEIEQLDLVRCLVRGKSLYRRPITFKCSLIEQTECSLLWRNVVACEHFRHGFIEVTSNNLHGPFRFLLLLVAWRLW